MKRDWIVLCVCLLLFGAGVVSGLGWVSTWMKTDFFKVANIHDFVEIASSLATVAAVFVALTAWKKQLRAQADHDLARRIMVCFERFKKATLGLIIDAQFCDGNSDLQYESYERITRVETSIASRLSLFDEEDASLQALLSEARAIWGGELDSHLERIRKVAAQAYRCNRHFLIFLDQTGSPDNQDELEADVYGINEMLRGLGLSGTQKEMLQGISRLACKADRYTKQKLSI